jgi:hypothetical protein
MTPREGPNRPSESEQLVAEALTAWRPRAPNGEILAHPAWADLDAASRQRLFDETLRSRKIEAALDQDGLSTTARAVLARIAPRL